MSLYGIDSIYWINLDRSPDRKEKMEKMFKDPCFDGIPKHRFSAIDGKAVDIDSYMSTHRQKLSDSEYACTLSHFAAIHEFLKSDYENALIMEDDCTLDFKKYWRKSMKEMMEDCPDDWQMILVEYISNDIPETEYKLNKNQYWSTGAYVINRKGAEKIIKDHYIAGKYHLKPEICHEADQYIFQVVTSYVYRYPYFTYAYNENSTLHNGAVMRHDESRKRIENMYEGKSDVIEGFSEIMADKVNNYYLYITLIIFMFILVIDLVWDRLSPIKKFVYKYVSKLMKFTRR